VSATIVRTITEAVPGPAGKALTDAVFHAYTTGANGQYLVLAVVGLTAIVTGTTLMGQIERALNRMYGIEQDRPTLQKYGRALVLALTAGVLATAAFAMFALGHGIGQGLGDDTVTQIWRVARWPIALVLMMAAIALLFRWSPRRHQPAWSWLAFGSTVSVVLWSLVTLGLGLFFQASTTFSKTYGPLAGMIALLLWALLSSVAILFGAAVAVQLEAVRAGAAAPRDEQKADDADHDGPVLAAVGR
jgi:YihY family inner membrane protein